MKIMDFLSSDAIIMDLGLPNIDGIQASANIKKLRPAVKIVVLTSHNTEEEVLASIKAGASAYCSKDINPERLGFVVESVLDGAAWFDPAVANIVLNAAVKDNAELSFNKNNAYSLTSRESQVLKLIKEGLNNDEISKKLFVSVNTIKVHVSSIIRKLGVDDRTQAAIKAFNDNIV